MPCPFKVGDWVRMVDPLQYSESNNFVPKGEVVRIVKISGYRDLEEVLYVENDRVWPEAGPVPLGMLSGYGYLARRFEPVDLKGPW